MKQMDVFKKIGGILKELNEQYDYLSAENSQLNELELELFVANAHFLKDHAEILRRLNERAASPEKTTLETGTTAAPPAVAADTVPAPKQEAHEQRYFEPVVQQQHMPPLADKPETAKNEPGLPAHTTAEPFKAETSNARPAASQDAAIDPQINLDAEKTGDSYSFERQEPEPVKHELLLEETHTWDNEEDHYEQEELTSQLAEKPASIPPPAWQPGQTQATEPQKAVNQPTSIPVSTETGNQVLTFNQKIMAQRAANDKNELPVTDLKSAINLNDKLLYVKDLFNGYSLAYSEAIEIVNRFNSFDEAERFLKTNYVAKNNWDSKPATTEKFYALLKRRYPGS